MSPSTICSPAAFLLSGWCFSTMALSVGKQQRTWLEEVSREVILTSRRKKCTHGQLWSVSVWLCTSGVGARGQHSDLDSDKQVTRSKVFRWGADKSHSLVTCYVHELYYMWRITAHTEHVSSSGMEILIEYHKRWYNRVPTPLSNSNSSTFEAFSSFSSTLQLWQIHIYTQYSLYIQYTDYFTSLSHLSEVIVLSTTKIMFPDSMLWKYFMLEENATGKLSPVCK